MKFGSFIKFFTLLCLFSADGLLAQPQIRLSTDTLDYQIPRFTWQTQNFTIYNDGDQTLNITISDQLQGNPKANFIGFKPTFNRQALLEKIRSIKIPVETSAGQIPGQSFPLSESTNAIVVSDSSGDTANPGLDVVSIDITDSFLTYDFEITFAAPPAEGAIAVISIDLDQNLATGEFPAPLGLGPGTFDIGADYNMIMDIANTLGDTLGLLPSAYVFAGGDTSLTPISLPWPLNINGNTVQVQLLKSFFPIVDANMNIAAVTLSVTSPDLPDLAPDYGHGLRGVETGLSWLAQNDSQDSSAIPLVATIPAGGSSVFEATVAAVEPEGDYQAEMIIGNNAGAGAIMLPVNLTIGGQATTLISVTPLQISDTLTTLQGLQNYDLTIQNDGSGLLIYLATDSTSDNGDWLSLGGFPAGQIGGGENATVEVQVDPTMLTSGQTYTGVVTITSNGSNSPFVEVPVNIFIDDASAIGDPGDKIAETVILKANYPNPFNPSTTIEFSLPGAMQVTLEIFNLQGQMIRTIADAQKMPGGNHYLQWDGRDNQNQSVASGVYLYRLRTASVVLMRKMLLLK